MMQQAITFDDVLLVPGFNPYDSRRDVDISMVDKTGKLCLSLPVMSANMDSITTAPMANFMHSKGGIGVLHRFMTIERNIEEFKKCEGLAFVSVGASEDELERAQALRDAGASLFCLDVAHAHAGYAGKALVKLRELLGDRCIMAGNVSTFEGAQYLADHGADIVKVGQGPGSMCSTRIKTGHGIPQLTAIEDCSRIDRSIVADGGIRFAGDAVKAYAFGADFVMVGGLLAGTDPTPGEVTLDEYKGYVKTYRGMSSKEVAEEYHGGLTEWRAAEGVSTNVPVRHDQDEIIADIVGGLRSGLTYAGAGGIKELQQKKDYVLVTQAGRTESLPHKLLEGK